ncbi:MAG: riboflavin synthase [Elusimicrobia bacterium]|nr:riboflavin synthase [Elusimicrobiota bacterium]
MFTGIIQSKGRVTGRKGLRLEITAPLARARVGDSVAVNGVCLTIVRSSGPTKSRRLAFDLSQETLDRTTIGGWRPGRPVNLEPALRAGDPLGGHVVQGHVDGVGRLVARRVESGWGLFTFAFPPAMKDFFVDKGSVAIDGISLTLLKPKNGRFGVAVIPHTEAVTTLGEARPGEEVNLEADVLAKQVAALMKRGRRS